MVVLDADRVDRISAQAEQIHLGLLLLTILAAVLFGLGWAAAKTVIVLGRSVRWSMAAVKVGWADARAANRA